MLKVAKRTFTPSPPTSISGLTDVFKNTKISCCLTQLAYITLEVGHIYICICISYFAVIQLFSQDSQTHFRSMLCQSLYFDIVVFEWWTSHVYVNHLYAESKIHLGLSWTSAKLVCAGIDFSSFLFKFSLFWFNEIMWILIWIDMNGMYVKFNIYQILDNVKQRYVF